MATLLRVRCYWISQKASMHSTFPIHGTLQMGCLPNHRGATHCHEHIHPILFRRFDRVFEKLGRYLWSNVGDYCTDLHRLHVLFWKWSHTSMEPSMSIQNIIL